MPATTLTFATGETAKRSRSPPNGDTAKEPNETFLVQLTSTGAALADSSGLGRISNDD